MNRPSLMLLICSRVRPNRKAGGFTLIELLVVIVIVGIAAAIAAPGWNAFINRQKVSKMNDRLLGSVQEARMTAKKTKTPQRLTFRNNNGVIEYAVTRSDVLVSTIRTRTVAWKALVGSERTGIPAGFSFACTNVATTAMNSPVGATSANALNTTGTICRTIPTVSAPTYGADADPLPSLVFDSNGGLPLNSNTGLMIVVGLNRRSNTTNSTALIPGSRRCVFIDTLLASTRTASGANCPTN